MRGGGRDLGDCSGGGGRGGSRGQGEGGRMVGGKFGWRVRWRHGACDVEVRWGLTERGAIFEVKEGKNGI